MKRYADKRRPYQQTSVSGSRINKLAKRFFGPFSITEQIGDVAFKLKLLATSRIHPVFHASQLKPFHGPIDDTITSLPDHTTVPLPYPVAVLDWRNAPNSTTQVLIQWSNAFPEDATWEDLVVIKAAYPDFHLEDKVLIQGEEDVMDLEEVQEPNEEEIEAHVNEVVDLEEVAPQTRAKRARQRPKWLTGYVTSKMKPTKK